MCSPRSLLNVFEPRRLSADKRLAPLTTFQIGGPADYYAEATSTDELTQALQAAADDGIPCTILGGGSNVLISDAGIRGLVIRVRSARIHAAGEGVVQADAGVTINGLVRWTIREGWRGLESWAGTPGTVGGALAGNAHWAGRMIGEIVREVAILGPRGDVRVLPASEMGFAYDTSRLQHSGDVALWATFGLEAGADSETLRTAARVSLHVRKQTQPLRMPSAGCIFQNPVPGRDVVPEGIPWSAGALIDRAGLKGYAVGGARISALHANFIVNEGDATAKDVRTLMAVCRREVSSQFGVELRDEIVCLGTFVAQTDGRQDPGAGHPRSPGQERVCRR